MLAFRKGVWYSIELPFSDPMLTEGHLRAAAAVAANHLVKGTSVAAAVAAAEKAMYEGTLMTSAKVKTFGG